MNSRTLQIIAGVVVVLIVALIAMERPGREDSLAAGGALVPGMREQLNAVTHLSVSRQGENPVDILRDGDVWGVEARSGYPADVGKIRSLLLGIADARRIEAKTGSPELHGRLGLRDPSVPGSKGVAVVVSGDDHRFSVILGNLTQGSFRYARLSGEDQTWLIDQNPDVPASIGDWLDADIIDVDAAAVQRVVIAHADGETLEISKADEAATGFDVIDVPADRELSYSTVANGIGGALNDLDLDDVRPATGEGTKDVTTTFETFDGRTITVTSASDSGENWLTLAVTGTDDAESERFAAWEYRVADYKANLFKRRWEDILKPADE